MNLNNISAEFAKFDKSNKAINSSDVRNVKLNVLQTILYLRRLATNKLP
jgi:hypothetical protein